MNRPKKKLGYTIGVVLLCALLSVSGYITLVVVGVIADEKINGEKNNVQSAYADSDYNITNDGYVSEDGNIIYDSVVDFGTEESADGSASANNTSGNLNTGNNGSVSTQNGGTAGVQSGNKYLDTNKSAADIVTIYATVMNKAKADRPGFTKIEYQELPSDPENRVISEGEEHVSAEWIDRLFGFIEGLGVFVPKEDALNDPYIHEKGDDDMSLFPVFSREKGSYLTDPKGIESFTYKVLPNGNVNMRFVLVSEDNPEPVAENSNVAPSYTGAVFSPMSKERIDGTVNHPVVSVFATDIEYSLRYHDCSVEVEFDPDTLEIVNLTQLANVSIKGSGNVRSVGIIGVERQELLSTVIIKDFKW